MIRKLTIVLLSIAVWMLGAIPALAVKYNEAPMLRTKVAASELPPVEERLPKNPVVIKPFEEIGQYGGVIRTASQGLFMPDDASELSQHGVYLFRPDPTSLNVYPWIATGYDISKDGKDFTIHLRKGVRWSDGFPFTADDILFWWKDVVLNNELTPTKPSVWIVNGKLPEFEKVDGYTFFIHFPERYSVAPLLLRQIVLTPKHYLKKWHIKYNPKAKELAKKEGYESWYRLYLFHAGGESDTNLPVLTPWMLEKRTTTQRVYVRNPYYFVVDSAGNQLPYIDRIVANLVGTIAIEMMKLMSGELDWCGYDPTVADYPLLKTNEKKGNYRVLLWDGSAASELVLAFNQNSPDPALRKIFQDLRFRQAMSVAIDREEINDLVFFGKGVPCQATVHPSCSFYREEWGKYYAEYNPEKANQLLDEIGLKWDKDHKWRLRPDGKTLAIYIVYYVAEGPKDKILELVKKDWEAVGVKVAMKLESYSTWWKWMNSGEADLGAWHLIWGFENRLYVFTWLWEPDPNNTIGGAPKWGMWLKTNGEKGEEPPESLKKWWSLFPQWRSAQTKEEYIKIAQEIFGTRTKELWNIGTVGYAPFPVVAKNNLRNIPEELMIRSVFGVSGGARPYQWFYNK